MFKDLEKIKKTVEQNDKIIAAKGLNPNKFCVVPFTNIILEPDGQVGICRQKGHNFSIGNIKDNTIDEIWNNNTIQSWRNEFLQGNISTCFIDMKHEQCHKCTENNELLPYVEINKYQSKPIQKLTANFNGKCNLQCRMCDVWKLPNNLYNEINFWSPAREKIFPHLLEVDILSGEPFIQPDTYRLIDEISAVNNRCKWTITTNAHWKMNEKITSSLNKIQIRTLIISIDSFIPETYAKIRPPGKLEIVLENLEKIIDYRTSRKDFSIHINFLVQKDNWIEVFNVIDLCYSKKINPFLTFLYEPSEYSLLSEDAATRKNILEFFFKQLKTREAVHLKKCLLPLIESMDPIDRSYYNLQLRNILCGKNV